MPPILIAQTTTVMMPIGAILSKMSSAKPMDVARNCIVKVSPNRVRSGAKSLKALFAKFDVSTVGFALAAVVVVFGMMNFALGNGHAA